jgi:CubicO group peptidase (beta-lactamase class C family)
VERLQFLAGSSALAGAASALSSVAAGQTATRSVGSVWVLPEQLTLQEWLAWSMVPGMSAALRSATRTTYAVAGVRAAGTQRLVDERTIFEAASLSKPVFAFAVLQLAERGALNLDKPLQSYLPAPYPIDDPRAASITARQVLSHSTGLQNWRFREDQNLKLAFAPGSAFSYSGEGFFYLQTVVEHIVGTGIADFLEQTVLRPLGMHDSSYVWRSDFAARLALPHDDDGQPSETRTKSLGEQLLRKSAASGKPLSQWTTADSIAVLPGLDPPQKPLPVFTFPNVAYSLLTTAADYLRFLDALPDAKALGMFVKQIAVNPGISWGLGVGLDTRNDRTMPFHWGNNDGFKNFFIVDAALANAVVAFSNGDRGLNVVERVAEETAAQRFAASLWIE